MELPALINELDAKFYSKETRYSRHSFASYLLDELYDLKKLEHQDKYTSNNWSKLKESLELTASTYSLN